MMDAMSPSTPPLSPAEVGELLQTLESRFAQNATRHPGLSWATMRATLETRPENLGTLAEMERTGGEPDVVDLGDGPAFVDCAPESPAGRRSLCYDGTALDARKAAKPEGSAAGKAQSMGVELLSEAQYRALQELGEFDGKTSSWVATPDAVRKLGGALFCDRRYGRVFTFHNGADSYYASRGFRGLLRL